MAKHDDVKFQLNNSVVHILWYQKYKLIKCIQKKKKIAFYFFERKFTFSEKFNKWEIGHRFVWSMHVNRQ